MLACRDADLMLAYTGLAEFDGRLTYFQLLDFFGDLRVTKRTLKHVTGQLREWLTRQFLLMPIRSEAKRLTVVMVGWQRPTWSPVLRVISNCEDLEGRFLEETNVRFIVTRVEPVDGYHLQNNGTGQGSESWKLFRRDALADLKQMIGMDRHWNKVQDYLMEVIREESDSPEYGNYIGKSCMVTVLYKHSLAQYYGRDDVDRLEYAPGLITDRGMGQITIAYAKMQGLLTADSAVTAIASDDPSDEHFRVLLPTYGLRSAPGLPRVAGTL